MAFSLTNLPRFYRLSSTAFDQSKVEAGAIYLLTDTGAMFVGTATGAGFYVKDTTVAGQITAAIDALTAADVELSTGYEGADNTIVAGNSVEAAIKKLHDRIAALAGTGGDDLDLSGLNAEVQAVKAAIAGFDGTNTVAKGIEAGVTEAKGYTDTEVAKKLGKGTIVAGDAEEIIVVSADGEASASGVKVAELVKGTEYAADKATFALKSEIADQLTKTEAGTTYAAKSELKAVTDDYLKAADKTELQGNIDNKVDQSAYDAQVALLATKAEIADQLSKTEAASTYAKIGDAYTKAEADGLLSAKADSASVAETYATKEALKDVTDDYLKGEDKTELEGKINAKLDASAISAYSTTEQMNTAISTALAAVLTFKGTKTTYAELPSEGNKQGDVWVVTEAVAGVNGSKEYVWTGTAWEELGDTQVFETMVQSELALTADKVILGAGDKNVKASAYGIGGETAEAFGAGNANTLATEAALAEILEVMCWKTTM